MKKLALARLTACARCRRAVAFLKSEDGEHVLGIPIEFDKARELLSRYHGSGGEKFLTDFLLRLLASSPALLLQVVLDCNKGGYLSAKVDLTIEGEAESLSCSPEDGLGLAFAAGIPLYAPEHILEQRYLFHPLVTAGENTDFLPPKPKPTLH